MRRIVQSTLTGAVWSFAATAAASADSRACADLDGHYDPLLQKAVPLFAVCGGRIIEETFGSRPDLPGGFWEEPAAGW